MNRLLILEETWKREQKAAEKKKTNSCKEKATEKKGEMVKAMKGMSFFEFYTHFKADFDPTSDKALVPTDSDHAKRWKITWNPDPQHRIVIPVPDLPDSGKAVTSPKHEDFCQFRLTTLKPHCRPLDVADDSDEANATKALLGTHEAESAERIDDIRNGKQEDEGEVGKDEPNNEKETGKEKPGEMSEAPYRQWHLAYEKFKNDHEDEVQDATNKGDVPLVRKLVESRKCRIIAKDNTEVEVNEKDPTGDEFMQYELDKDEDNDAMLQCLAANNADGRTTDDYGGDEDIDISTEVDNSHWDAIAKQYEDREDLEDDWIGAKAGDASTVIDPIHPKSAVNADALNFEQHHCVEMLRAQYEDTKAAIRRGALEKDGNGDLKAPWPKPIQQIVYGKGGTGKSFVLRALKTLIDIDEDHLTVGDFSGGIKKGTGRKLTSSDLVTVMAPTGNAAINVDGSTTHSALGFGYQPDDIPANTELTEGSKALVQLQSRLKYSLFYFCDEFGMVSSETLALMEERMRQAHAPHVGHAAFGGRNVILFGHHAQLPLIAEGRSGVVYPIPTYSAKSKSKKKPTAKDKLGRRIYKDHFKNVVILREQMRQRASKPSEEKKCRRFKSILDDICEGTLSAEDYRYLQKHNDELLASGSFAEDPEVEYLCSKKKAVAMKNKDGLEALHLTSGEPIVRINAVYAGDTQFAATKAAEDKAKFEKSLYLSKGAKVMCIWNGWQEAGLVNGAVGTVHEIIYGEGKYPPFDMPAAILVSFPVGSFYRGPSYLGDDDDDDIDTTKERIVKFIPEKQTYTQQKTKTESATWSQLQFPLVLAYGRTTHKAQGCTMDRIVGDVGDTEYAAGLSYVLWSRATSHDGICLDPFPTYGRMLRVKDKIVDRQRHERDLEQIAYECCKRHFEAARREFNSTTHELDEAARFARIKLLILVRRQCLCRATGGRGQE